MNSSIHYHRHLGVYGLCLDETGTHLLVIHKTGGPYRGRYDLPGGGIDLQESLVEAITREFREETGFSVQVRRPLGTFDFLVRFPFRDTTHTHHIAVFYEVTLAPTSDGVPITHLLDKPNGTEENDSAGHEWVLLDSFTEANTSPLVRKALRWIRESQLSPEMELYDDWVAL